MLHSLKNFLASGQTQLNIIGAALLTLLGLSAWNVARPFSIWSIVPLILIGYAMFRVMHELTFNRKNVPTLATGYIGRRKIAHLLKKEALARGKGSYKIIDLGSGRGELARRIACTIPEATVLGIEKARFPVWQSSLIQRLLGPNNLSYAGIDFWPFDCADIDAVVFYLTPTLAQKVGEKLKKELKPGSLIISHTFPLGGDWTPLETLKFRSPFQEVLHVYRKA